MKKKSMLVWLMILMLSVSGCGSNTEDEFSDDSSEKIEENTADENNESVVPDDSDMFSDRDMDASYDEESAVFISLNDTSATCDSDVVLIEGSTITITDEGTYVIEGNLDNGMLIVNAEDSDKPQLVLNRVTISNESSAALYILEADKVFVTLAEGSENTLSNGGSFEAIDENNIDGTIFSKQDLTFNGSGSLTVESPADHGIVCKDDLVITGGDYSITTASHGIDANDSFRLASGNLTIAAGKDGIHVENEEDTEKGFVYLADGTLDITAEGDGISASSTMKILDGKVQILCGGGYENGTKSSSDGWGNFGGGMGKPGGGHGGGMPGSSGSSSADSTEVSYSSTEETTEDSTSMKGLKSDGDMCICGGSLKIDAADDTIHSNASIEIIDGDMELASGDDGIHAEENLTVTGGKIQITQSYEGLEALHIDVSAGEINLVSSDDGFNAAGGTDSSGMGGRDQMGMPGGGMGGMSGNSDGTIVVSGGEIYIKASGDGIDANGTLEISDGYVVVCGPTSGDTATLDYDQSAVITGGTFIGTGSISMAQVFSDAEQGIFAVQCSCTAGSEIKLTDQKGNAVISYTPELDFTFICLSSPEIEAGEEYTISVDDVSGTFEAY